MKRADIERAVEIAHSFEKGTIKLSKSGGFWYWSGEHTHGFSEACTFSTTLNDMSVEQWVEDFQLKREQSL